MKTHEIAPGFGIGVATAAAVIGLASTGPLFVVVGMLGVIGIGTWLILLLRTT